MLNYANLGCCGYVAVWVAGYGQAFWDVLAGYGYQPVRTVIAYLLLVFGFAFAYMQFGIIDEHAFHFDVKHSTVASIRR